MGRQTVRAVVTAPVRGGQASLIPDTDLRRGWVLTVDGAQQSHVDLADATHLVFEYTRRIGHVIDLLPPGPLRAVHLGGGAMTLARYASATRPRTTNLVVEHDAELVDLVRGHLPWPKEYRIRVRRMEAREALASLTPEMADLVILDAFSGARTPGSLTSIQAVELARRAMAPTGTLVANIADSGDLTFARRYVAGLRAVFDRVLLCAEPAVLRGRRFGNFVVVAQGAVAEPLNVAALVRRCAGDPTPSRVVHGGALSAFVGGRSPTSDGDTAWSPAPPAGFLPTP